MKEILLAPPMEILSESRTNLQDFISKGSHSNSIQRIQESLQWSLGQDLLSLSTLSPLDNSCQKKKKGSKWN